MQRVALCCGSSVRRDETRGASGSSGSRRKKNTQRMKTSTLTFRSAHSAAFISRDCGPGYLEASLSD